MPGPKKSNVSLYLVEDGVTAARKSEFGNKLLDAKKKGIRILTDDKSVQSRGLVGKLIGGLYDLGEWTAESDKTILLG